MWLINYESKWVWLIFFNESWNTKGIFDAHTYAKYGSIKSWDTWEFGFLETFLNLELIFTWYLEKLRIILLSFGRTSVPPSVPNHIVLTVRSFMISANKSKLIQKLSWTFRGIDVCLTRLLRCYKNLPLDSLVFSS